MNEQLYLYITNRVATMPNDYEHDYWYTILSIWIDYYGSSNILWYIRKTYNYLFLHSDLSINERINLKLQLIFILHKYISDTTINVVSTHLPSWSEIINKWQGTKINHLCNYLWVYDWFLKNKDVKRLQSTMYAAEHINTGIIISPKVRNDSDIIRKIINFKTSLSILH